MITINKPSELYSKRVRDKIYSEAKKGIKSTIQFAFICDDELCQRLCNDFRKLVNHAIFEANN